MPGIGIVSLTLHVVRSATRGWTHTRLDPEDEVHVSVIRPRR